MPRSIRPRHSRARCRGWRGSAHRGFRAPPGRCCRCGSRSSPDHPLARFGMESGMIGAGDPENKGVAQPRHLGIGRHPQMSETQPRRLPGNFASGPRRRERCSSRLSLLSPLDHRRQRLVHARERRRPEPPARADPRRAHDRGRIAAGAGRGSSPAPSLPGLPATKTGRGTTLANSRLAKCALTISTGGSLSLWIRIRLESATSPRLTALM